MDNESSGECLSSCGCAIFLLIFNFIVGGIATNYLLNFVLHKTIAFGWAGIIGIVGGEVIVPMAIVVWILHGLGLI